MYFVVIRTNGGNLTIDASTDTVKHYGDGVVLNIDAIASSSYHESGYFPKAIIKKGRIVVESAGKIQVIDATAATAAVVVEKAGTGTVANIVKGENANVEVAADLTEKIATLTTVTTWSALKTEVESGTNNVIKFEPTEEQTNATTISIARSVSILGNNTLVTGTNDGLALSNGTKQWNGLINITGTGIDVGLDSLNLQSTATSNSRSAINFVSGNNTVVVTNSTLTAKYGICSNIEGADNNKLTLKYVSFGASSYCSLFWRSNNGVINANNTSFSSFNSSNNNQSDGFATIVIDFRQKTAQIDSKTENNVLTLTDCKISATQLGNAVQSFLAVWSPYNNIVNLNNCGYSSNNCFMSVAKGFIADPACTGPKMTTQYFDVDFPTNSSHIYVDGSLADDYLNVVQVVTIPQCIPCIKGTTTSNHNTYGGPDYAPLYGYEQIDNGNGTWTYRKAN